MSKKHNHIDELSPELFKEYQEGNLCADEMYAVEKYLLDNPFEAEALEGLEALSPGTLDGHLNDLHARLDAKLSEKKETKVVFWTMTRKLAASLLILLTAGLLYFLPGADTAIGTKELSENANERKEEVSKNANIPEKDSKQGPASLEKTDNYVAGKAEDKTDSKKGWTDRLDNDEEALVASTEAEPESKMGFDASEPMTNSQTARNEVNPSPTIKAKSNIPASFKAQEESALTEVVGLDGNSTTNGLKYTSDSMQSSLRDDKFGKILQSRVEGVITEPVNLKANLESESKLSKEQVLTENQTQVLGYFNTADSTTKFKAELETSQKLLQARAQEIVVDGRSEKRKKAFNLPDSLTRTITGLVTDDEGEPLRGVSVQVKGTSVGVLTKTDGTYTLITDAKQEGSILFRYLGYSTMEVDLKKQSVLNVEIFPSMMSVSEVVVSDFSPPSEVEEEEEEGDTKSNIPARPIYGQKAFNDHVKENLIYPEVAAAQNIRGRVLVEFTVAENGDLKDFKILKSLGYGCDEEAIRLIKTGPRWQARTKGIKESRPVESKVKVRIRFKQ